MGNVSIRHIYLDVAPKGSGRPEQGYYGLFLFMVAQAKEDYLKLSKKKKLKGSERDILHSAKEFLFNPDNFMGVTQMSERFSLDIDIGTILTEGKLNENYMCEV